MRMANINSALKRWKQQQEHKLKLLKMVIWHFQVSFDKASGTWQHEKNCGLRLVLTLHLIITCREERHQLGYKHFSSLPGAETKQTKVNLPVTSESLALAPASSLLSATIVSFCS